MKNYILLTEKGLIVDNDLIEKTTPYSYINRLALSNFKTITSITKATIKITNKRYILPLYISDRILLVQLSGIKSNDYFAFNYYSLKELFYSNDETTLLSFKDGTLLKVNISKNRFESAFQKLNLLLKNIDY